MIKEACVLSANGYGVHVVAADVSQRWQEFDKQILAECSWQKTFVAQGGFVPYVFRTIAQRAARFLLATVTFANMCAATIAHNRLSLGLIHAAKKIRADLYIAHNLAALPAAAVAAKRNSARLGFDAEDFHIEELTVAQRSGGDQLARQIIEERLLPLCVHRTAASPLIAQAYRDKYGIDMVPVLNVFPLSEASDQPVSISGTHPRSLYWFSQTIGEGRGLEQIIEAIAYMADPCALYLRGWPVSGYIEKLAAYARTRGISHCIHHLSAAAPSEMVRLAAPYSLGLSLELTEPPNRAICLTNKIFTYLLAGIPVLLSRTPAQEELAASLGLAAIVIDLSVPKQIAKALTDFFNDPVRQNEARACSWKLGRERYNWDLEKATFLQSIERALST